MTTKDAGVFDYCDAAPPFPAGGSPFHIKGQFYIQAMKALGRLQKEGIADPMTLLPGDLREFLSQGFLASSWYDALPFPRIAMIEAKARRMDVRTLTTEQARRAAEHGLRGVYKLFIPMFLPKTVALRSLGSRMVGAIGQFYDFGPAKVIEPSDSHTLTVERRGVPLCMIEWWCINACGYAEAGLRVAGLRDVTTEFRYEPTGTEQGVALGRAVITVRRPR